jgi:hypothetical protein
VTGVEPELTTTDTRLLFKAVVGGTVHVINEKLITVGFVHKLPSTVTDEDDENPTPVTFNVYPPPIFNKNY